MVPVFMDDLDFVEGKWIDPGIVKTARFRNNAIGYRQLIDQNIDTYTELRAMRDTLADLIDRPRGSP